MAKVFELLRTGNFQAQVIKDITPFKKGDNVDMMLNDNDYVCVTNEQMVEKWDDTNYEEYNLDTHEDYDKYFRIY